MNSNTETTARVTGGVTGIGAAITTRLAAGGTTVFVARRGRTAPIPNSGSPIEGHCATPIRIASCDVFTGEGSSRAAAEGVARFGGIKHPSTMRLSRERPLPGQVQVVVITSLTLSLTRTLKRS